MDSSEVAGLPPGGLVGAVLRAVAPLVAGGDLLEVTRPPDPGTSVLSWPAGAGPRRHERIAAGSRLGAHIGDAEFDVALVRGAAGATGGAGGLGELVRVLRRGATMLVLVPPEGAALTAAELAAAGLREVCRVTAAEVPWLAPDSGTAQVLRAGGEEGEDGEAAAALIRDPGLAYLVRTGIGELGARVAAAHDREEARIEIEKLTTTLRARDVSLTRRVERADRNALRWQQRYEQLRNRPALRLAAAVSERVRRIGGPPGPTGPSTGR